MSGSVSTKSRTINQRINSLSQANVKIKSERVFHVYQTCEILIMLAIQIRHRYRSRMCRGLGETDYWEDPTWWNISVSVQVLKLKLNTD